MEVINDAKAGLSNYSFITYHLYKDIFSVHGRMLLLIILTNCAVETKNNFIFGSFNEQLFVSNV